MIIKNVDKRALSEVYAYLNFVGPRYLKRIPKELIQLIRSKMDKKYYYHFSQLSYLMPWTNQEVHNKL